MRTQFVVIAILSCLAFAAGPASAKGCLKGAAVGGVGGHVAGKHGVLGAATGCVVGRHLANKKDREQAAQSAPAAAQSSTAPASSTDSTKK